MKTPYYITTTLPYVNAEPHIGFALEIVQADMLARIQRLRGDEVIFNTGTDEHGQKIYKKALEAGIEPKAYCDGYAEKFHELKELLNLTYTNFIRTTDDKHVAAAQEFWKRCDANGDIYKKQYQTKYCVGCELEKTDSELVDDRCPIHPKMEIELRDEENYFFRWSKYQQPLLDYYAAHPDFVMPTAKFNEIKNFVAAGLNDFSISRLKDKMPWGIAVPGDEEHVMYVWFDALVNYISTLDWFAVTSAQGGGDVSESFEKFWPGVQVAGIDNLRQQSAMWQAMLLSAGLPLSKQIFIHSFITVDGQKMSKSLGNVIGPKDLVAMYGTDAVRYYLLREMPYGTDGDYSAGRMEERFAELANDLGNLMGRVAAMSIKYFDGEVDKVPFNHAELDVRMGEALKHYDFKAYIDTVWTVVNAANLKIQTEEPFKLAKTDADAAKKSLSELAAMIVWIGYALSPVIPTAADEILRRYTGDKLIHGEPLFPRRDQELNT
ncbi:MAG: methionine--tRNA ligase [Patescibacteria group bacterium]